MILLCVLVIAGAALMAQHAHYRELATQREHKDTAALSAELEARIREMDDLKKQVESLVNQERIRAGFKIK